MAAEGVFGSSGTSEPSSGSTGRGRGTKAGIRSFADRPAPGFNNRKRRPDQESPYGPVMGVSADSLNEGTLAPGGDPDGLQAPSSTSRNEPPEDPYGLARSIVLRHLAMAPKSRHQLAQKLAERAIPDEVAGAVLDRFEEVQLIDDAEFAMMWVRSRSVTRSLARSVLKRELADKGVDTDVAEEALGQISDADERAAAGRLIRRKMRSGIDLSDRGSAIRKRGSWSACWHARATTPAWLSPSSRTS